MFQRVIVVATIFILASFCFWMGECDKSKYSKDSQFTTKSPAQWEFRQRRANQVWEKAQRIGLSPQNLDALKKELKAHDDKAMKWKKLQRDGGDPDGEKEATLRRELAEIMRRYGMAKDAMAEEKSIRQDGGKEFEDLRLNRIWNQAVYSGQFSSEELRELKRELGHHQDKVDEFKQLMNDLQGVDGSDINRVDKFKRLDVDEAVAAKDRKVQELELKLKHKELNEGLKKLELKARREHEQSGFKEPRLHQMWMDALKANFTEDELESLKEEMKHFEKKLIKHESIKDEAIRAELEYHKAKKSGEHHDSSYFENLKERAKETAHTVKKYFSDFSDRISSRRHSEL